AALRGRPADVHSAVPPVAASDPAARGGTGHRDRVRGGRRRPSAVAVGAVRRPWRARGDPPPAAPRRIGLPRRVITILEGESLLNDATALVMVRVSVTALGTAVGFWDIAGQVMRNAGGG